MKKLLFVFVGLLIFSVAFSQNDETWKCATDEVYNELVKNNPDLLIERQKLDAFVQDYIRNNPKTDQVYIIPVVFHVVHNYGAENISYDQILGAVEWMNKDYRLQRSDTSQIHPAFKNIAADTKIEFRLARIDPNGDCTIGVTRTISETTYAGGEDAKDAAPTWPPEMYLNVWTVFSLGNGAAGWSYYPGTAPYGSDGIILLHDYIGVSGTSTAGHGSVITHEAGHFLNLPHPWGSTNDPELQSNCDIDDGISDTPNTIGHTSCNVNAVSCGSLDNVQNFMEYSYCYKMFTLGQSNVMRATLNSSVSGRNNLWSPANLIATGTNDGYTPDICAPVADFKSNKNMGCNGFTVQYNDLSYNTDFIGQYNWTLEGGEPATSIESDPLVVYNQKGQFDTQLYVENPTNFDSKTELNYIRVYDVVDGFSLPYTESFETPNFPLITGNTNNDFYIDPAGERTWEQSNLGYSGKSIKILNRYNENGVMNRIYLPNIYVENPGQAIKVSLKIAYGRSDEVTSDRLKFYASTTCGDSLRIVQVLSGSTLTSTYVSAWSSYTPATEDWKTQTFTINSAILKSNNLRLVIEAESGGGNTIYVDEVSFELIPTDVNNISSEEELSIYPNPCYDDLFIQNPESDKALRLTLTDYTGKIIQVAEAFGHEINASSLIQNLPAGIYFLKTETNSKVKTFKLIKE